MKTLRLLDIPNLDYISALELMRGLVAAKTAAPKTPDALILVEHQPVFTLGKRSGENDVLVPENILKKEGITIHRIERGGLITYHGPGQLVVYPILHLDSMGLGIKTLVNQLEEVVILTLDDYGIKAGRNPGYPGVWSDNKKIASIGLAVRHGVTFHGLALNYNPKLAHFGMINPCGMSEVQMTSMVELLGEDVDPDKLRTIVKNHFQSQLEVKLDPWELSEARSVINNATNNA